MPARGVPAPVRSTGEAKGTLALRRTRGSAPADGPTSREGRRFPLFERFTDRARRVLVLAQEEARLLNHNFIGTEHILLGLIHEGEGVAAKALESLGISLEAVQGKSRGDHRPGRVVDHRLAALYAQSEEGTRALACERLSSSGTITSAPSTCSSASSVRAKASLPGARQPGRRPVAGAPTGHPAPFRLPVPGGGKETGAATWVRSAPGQETPTRLAGPRPVRAQPHPACPRAQARSGDRPGSTRSSG